MIAKRANVSLSAIPYYFNTKENLFNIIISQANQEFMDYFAAITEKYRLFFSKDERTTEEACSILSELFNRHIDYVLDPQNERLILFILQLRMSNMQLRMSNNPKEESANEKIRMSNNPKEESAGKKISWITAELFTELIMFINPNLERKKAFAITCSIVGSHLYFAYHKASILKMLNLDHYDADSIAMIREVQTNGFTAESR